MKQTLIKRGEVFWVDFDHAKDNEIKKIRPAIVCSHHILNENSSCVIVTPISSNSKKIYSFEYAITSSNGLEDKIMLDQVKSPFS